MSAPILQRASASTRVLALLLSALLAGALLTLGITEEVAMGAMEGKVTLKENGRVMKDVEVDISPTNELETDVFRPRRVKTDSDGRFVLRSLPAGDYTVYAYAKAHRLDGQRITIREGDPTVFELQMAPVESYLNLNASQKVFLPAESPSFQADGFLPDESLKIDVFKINLADIVQKGGIEDLLRSFTRHAQNRVDPAKAAQRIRTVDHSLTKRDAEGIFVEQIGLEPLPEGFYWVRCTSGKVDRGVFLNVSKIAMIAKAGKKQTTVFVTDLDTGQPIENAPIARAEGPGLKQVGMSAPDGTLTVPNQGGDNQLLIARMNESAAVVDYYVSDEGSAGGQGRVFLYSDRPVYRPGDTIQFKGISRTLVGSDFQVPRQGTVQCVVRDADENVIENLTLKLTSKGTFFGSFSTNKEAKPGVYSLEAVGPGGEGTLNIRVASYRKPEFKITVSPLADFYVFGQRAKFNIKCEYYHGGPVVGAKVEAYVTRSPAWEWMDEEGVVYADESGSGEGVEELKTMTGANGEAVIEFDTKKPEEGDYGSDMDYTYNVLVVAADEGDKYFEGNGSVKVTRGMFQTAIETSEYIGQVGAPVELTVTAKSYEDESGLPGKEFAIIAGEENWSGGKVTFQPIETLRAITGTDGTAKLAYAPKRPGSLVFKAVIEDELKNKIESSAYVYVEGSGVPARPTGKLSLTLDKRNYRIGDTAKALIQTDKPGGFALLTVEADEVMYERVVNLTQSVTVVPLEVTKPFAPNAQVSVAYVREKQFYEASSPMVLTLNQQKLQITISPDRETVLPGQAVTYSIATRDHLGMPVSADLSLGVVDESIYAIREDDTDPYLGFFPRRSIRVQTWNSFPEIYLDGGDKGAGNVPIRSKFMDTAYWNADIHTDAGGVAQVTVTLPDNITTWRATVVGSTDSTAVGIATRTVLATKPLTIRLQTPQYMVVQDKQKISATIQNDTGAAADLRVGVSVKGIELDGPSSQSVRVMPGEPRTVEWYATAKTTGEAEIVATAEITGGANDGVKSTFPIKPHGREFLEIESGMAKGTASFDLMVRDGADRNTGRLVVKLSPSIATTLVQSLDGLVQFPYGCVEQTMSRFLPAILVDKALADTGLSRPDLRAKVPEIAADGLTRLATMQHGDGGWGWWEYDESDPFMTALVLDGLQRAKAAGFKVNESMLNRGLSWANERFASEAGKKDELRDRVYLCYVLAANDRANDAKKHFKFDFKDAGTPDLALGALTANLLGDSALQASLIGKLKARAKATPQTAYWPQEQNAWGQECTAMALMALVKLDPQSELVPKTVRNLMQARRGDYWYSTRDTSYVLIGMTEYLRSTKELGEVDGTVEIALNGNPLKTVAFTKQSLFAPELRIEVPMSELTVGNNRITLTQSGTGVCYYTADLKQVIPDANLGDLVKDTDLQVERTYYRMESRRMEDGTMKFERSTQPVTTVKSGDVIRVVLKVRSSKEREFMMLEDPVPSNFRVTERDAPYEDEQWGWWWARTVILDDRVSFFARTLGAGEQEFSYVMRAEADGAASALPTRIGNMYDPDDYASNKEQVMEIRP